MASVKTAISIQEPLFEQVEALASELNISRSRIFVLAVEEFIERHTNRQILSEINSAYDDLPDVSEQEYMKIMKQQQKRMVEGQW